MCLCDGYHLVDGSCTDFDESIATPDICGDDANIDCQNRDAVTDGMPYECTCGIGWEQNAAGDACVDVDECLLHVADNYDNNVPTTGRVSTEYYTALVLSKNPRKPLSQVHVIALTTLFALIMTVPMHVLVNQDTK